MVSPTYVPDLVHATLDLLVDGEQGIWHLTNEGQTSWSELAQRVASEVGLDWRAKPAVVGEARNRALSSERSLVMPSLDSAIARYFADCEVDWKEARLLNAAE